MRLMAGKSWLTEVSVAITLLISVQIAASQLRPNLSTGLRSAPPSPQRALFEVDRKLAGRRPYGSFSNEVTIQTGNGSLPRHSRLPSPVPSVRGNGSTFHSETTLSRRTNHKSQATEDRTPWQIVVSPTIYRAARGTTTVKPKHAYLATLGTCCWLWFRSYRISSPDAFFSGPLSYRR